MSMRILVADDHQLVRRGVNSILSKQAGWEVCGEAEDALQAFEKTCELRPDLILLDISMPGGNGLDTARKIREKVPEVKILMMSHYDAAQFLPTALARGADGCIDKSRLALDLIDAIKGVQDSSASKASS